MFEVQASRPAVLVVDDTPANLVAMRRLLAKMDCDIVEADNGNDALAACLDREFALILLDVQMPEMDGFEVASLLAETPDCKNAPIIFVTAAYKDDLNRLNGYEVGAVDYIAKPINEFILLSKVKVFLDLYRSRAALKTAEAAARHRATHDALTDLPNRLLFTDRLGNGLSRARRDSSKLALVYLDVDHFKPVNDRHGHAAGDLLLKAIAGRLQRLLRESDTVARLGGDEFAAILENVASREDAQSLAELMRIAMHQPFSLQLPDQPQPIEVQVGASVGVALFPEDGGTEDALIAQADEQMYTRKKARA
ncbi:diguanylate cyclase [Solimonas sp. C16B3]|uniref:Diguanylate cyclase n=2 Tax=Solimonas marina TaxID=2714601 RepID=A0A970B6A2_9GAMM|nr:diguanylate cyclase [Solimonas marina]